MLSSWLNLSYESFSWNWGFLALATCDVMNLGFPKVASTHRVSRATTGHISSDLGPLAFIFSKVILRKGEIQRHFKRIDQRGKQNETLFSSSSITYGLLYCSFYLFIKILVNSLSLCFSEYFWRQKRYSVFLEEGCI